MANSKMGMTHQSVLRAAGKWRGQFTVLDSGPEGGSGELPVCDGTTVVPSDLASLQQFGRLSDAFFAAAAVYADRPALTIRGRVFDYAALAKQAKCVAGYLQSKADFQPGDRVGLMLDNSPEFIAGYYGVLAAGGVLVPLPANIEWSRLERIASICSATHILTQHHVSRRRAEIVEADCQTWDLRAETPREVLPVAPCQVNEQSLAMIMFTSGSSGDPKGVMLSDANLLANAQSILQYLPITSDDRALAVLPFYHAFGHSILQTHLLAGASLVVDGNMAFPNTIVDALEHHSATSFSAVPEGYYSLLSMSDLATRHLPHLRYMSVAGGALKAAAVVEVANSIAPAEFYVMYGQTEASARLAYLPPELSVSHPHSMGKAIPDVELCVLDSDGQPAAANETGELCARGANVMLGYWNDAAATEKALADGWLHTGDLASRDEDGYFYVKARKNDLVKVQGFRVHPREVEDAVARFFPGLRVVVVPYQYNGTTRLSLFGITNQVNAELMGQLRRICARELPRHKVPSYVEVLAQAPLNASMKLDRTALRRRAECQASLSATSDAVPSRLSA